MPEAVEPGIYSIGVLSGTREVLLLLMYIDDVFHWFVIAATVETVRNNRLRKGVWVKE